ncbi:hypothetical protein DBA26_13445 [Brucella canis]|uniref:Uncharacterized protein n=9 Tax=Brucella TaxID=234 RepID=Q2YN85_BRUA2|nr:hypothetical protein BR0742 [Brucella suis 1330]AAX74129.1 hypothetical protein BruAb1_0759 [Brucella abortus bv. 1 str. 9-941]ABX61828.1 Hypothetical protein, conserved [Brucella canis ATCC 23365]ABY37848.1 Hypothetical protein, conserved [Brucella suis ATCC 23445]ACU47734.1 hypothetical protein BMI_I740 [Brucella microti CCM 4915]AEK54071.1 hypothetical protein BPI_I779 [Brucella pinnipedialis B2/94]AEU05756.1 hypothetical protein BSVBI22_A0738 [Brucella suis VBI22]AHN46380.1 hypothetic
MQQHPPDLSTLQLSVCYWPCIRVFDRWQAALWNSPASCRLQARNELEQADSKTERFGIRRLVFRKCSAMRAVFSV